MSHSSQSTVNDENCNFEEVRVALSVLVSSLVDNPRKAGVICDLLHLDTSKMSPSRSRAFSSSSNFSASFTGKDAGKSENLGNIFRASRFFTGEQKRKSFNRRSQKIAIMATDRGTSSRTGSSTRCWRSWWPSGRWSTVHRSGTWKRAWRMPNGVTRTGCPTGSRAPTLRTN